MKVGIFLLGMVVTMLSGCSVFAPGGSDFSCPGMPKGVTCKTPREVYDISTGKTPKKGKAAKAGDYNPSPVEVLLVGSGGSNLEPVPVLEQAKVMRIWIAPWVDKNKDLHWPGMIFTQVQARQWAVGNDNFEGIEPPVPRRSMSSASKLLKKSAEGEGGDGSAKTDESEGPQTRLQDEVLN